MPLWLYRVFFIILLPIWLPLLLMAGIILRSVLKILLYLAWHWGKNHDWPVRSEYPQYSKVRAIGKFFFYTGGLEEMQAVHARIKNWNPHYALTLDAMWDRVGPWMH